MSSSTESTSTSRSLLAGARANEGAAWQRLVTLYAPSVLRWCRRDGLSEEDAADVFQEVFHAVARKLPDFRKDRPTDTFRGWLRTITRNKTHDHWRKRLREPRSATGSSVQRQLDGVAAPVPQDGDSTRGAPGDDVSRDLFRRALDRIRDRFQAKTWQAFWRTVVDGQSAPDVADELDMSPGAVRVAKSRVLARLRQELGDQP